MNTKYKGDIAVSAAIHYFTSNNYEVLLPIGDKKSYDIVVEQMNRLYKVQVKYAGLWKDKNKCVASLRVMGGNRTFYNSKKYDINSFDLLFVYSEKKACYLFPWNELNPPRSSITVDSPEYNKYIVNMQG